MWFRLETTKHLALLHNNVLDEITSSNCELEKKRLGLFHTLSVRLDNRPAPDLNCLPESFRFLMISGVSTIPEFKWPKFLTHFKLSSITQGYPKAALRRVGPNLRSFNVRFANVKNGIMPKLIGSPNITQIMVQYSNVTFVEKDTFIHNHRLKRLDLTGNHITTFDAIMPPRLASLFLRNNKIEVYNFNSTAISQLEYLGLQKNSLKACPMLLPKSLKMLVLNHNKIEICSPEALGRLTELKHLDLANNKYDGKIIVETVWTFSNIFMARPWPWVVMKTVFH